MPSQKEHIAVLGAGNMGSGIAQAFASAGYPVVVRDLTEKELARGRETIERNLNRSVERGRLRPEKRDQVLSAIEFTTELKVAAKNARLVIEAVFEEEKVKKTLFSELAPLVGEKTLVVTNTSSLSVSHLFEGFPLPERCAGLHFFFPASVNRLVEIIPGPNTSKATMESLLSISYSIKKIPIRVRDSPGFCINRFFVPFLNEATRLLEDKVADIPTIEAAANELLGTKMGPFELMNVTGIPIAYHSNSTLGKALGKYYHPSALLKEQFEKGEKWKIEGEANPAQKEAAKGHLAGVLLGIASRLVEEGVATAEETDRGARIGLAWRVGPFSLLNEMGTISGYEQVDKIHRHWGGAFPVSSRLAEVAISNEPWPLTTVRLEKDGPIAWILLDRPDALNALNSKVLLDLERAVKEAASDAGVHVLLLSSTSNNFAAGADIAEMVTKTPAESLAYTTLGHRVLSLIDTLEKPVIAVVDGYALGGGLELSLSADFILASEEANLGLPEVSLGIIPGFGGTQRLARRIGDSRAKLMILTGTHVRAPEACAMGLVARTYPAEKLKDEARELALTIASRAPVAVRLAKDAVDFGIEAPLPSGLALEKQLATYTFTTEDLREGMKAYLEKRKPEFKGR
jgi:enoyl-CoA hydratase/3-hydroxyacyl-CoA dehydrogenase